MSGKNPATYPRSDLRLGKELSWLLRHGAQTEQLPLRPDGYLPVAALLQHPRHGKHYTLEVLQRIVNNDQKNRYTLRQTDNGEYEICANQGHSLEMVQASQLLEKLPMNTPDKQHKGGGGDVKMAGLKRKTQYLSMNKCTKCSKEFSTLADSLQHELLAHEANNSLILMSKNTLHLPKHMARDILEDAKGGPTRDEVHQIMTQCKPGAELQKLCSLYCLNRENMEWVTTRIIQNLQREINWIAHFKIYPFGSVRAGLALKDSDLDFYIAECEGSVRTNDQFNTRSRHVFNKINRTLHRSLNFEEVVAIRHARVPIIKCKHVETGFSLDINITCASSVQNTNFFRDLIHSNQQIYQLMLFLKIWAKKQKVIKPGNLSSYCFMTLVLFSLQQPGENYNPLLPPINNLQNHSEPMLVSGVNYAYDLSELRRSRPQATSVPALIKQFFRFYNDFNFGDLIVAPNYGSPVPRSDFITGKFAYPAYEQLLHGLSEHLGTPAEELQVDRCMIVQDVFHLNLNISKQVAPAFLDYFRKCIRWSHQICTDPSISTDNELYHRLVFCVLDKIENVHPDTTNTSDAQPNYLASHNYPLALKYEITPNRDELQFFRSMVGNNEIDNAERLWAQHYIATMEDIIKKIYKFTLETIPTPHVDKQPRMESSSVEKSWLLTGDIDLWSGRLQQRMKSANFMTYHCKQSELFLEQRSENPKFKVFISALFVLKFGNRSLQIGLVPYPEPKKAITKRDPLRRFFANLKTILQAFNLKETLQALQKLNITCPSPEEAAVEKGNETQDDGMEGLSEAEVEKSSAS